MFRGLISGLFWGLVVSVLGLAVLSITTGMPDLSKDVPNSGDVAVPAGSEFNRNRPEALPVIPGSEGTAPEVDAPLVTDAEGEAAPVADTASAAVPESDTQALSGLAAPDTDTAGLALSQGDDAAQASGSTPEMNAPEPVDESAPETPEDPEPNVVPEGTAPEVQPEQPVLVEDAPASPSIQLPETTEMATTPDTAPAEPDATEVPAETAGANVDVEPAPTPSTDEAEPPQTAQQTETSPTPVEPAVDVAQAETEAPQQPTTPTRTIVRRLPTIGTPDPEPAPETETEPAPEPETAPEAEDGEGTEEGADPVEEEPDMSLGAMARNALPFTRATEKPLMSIILIDVGAEGLDQATLQTFSFPIAIAVDPFSGNAAEAAKGFREAGQEVLIQSGVMPEGITPNTIGAYLEALVAPIPEAIGVVDAAKGGFQSNRRLLEDAVVALSTGGHGLVTYDRGLNSALKAAAKQGVPSGAIYRTLDAEKENAHTILRYLDRAAFRAGQEGHVIMIGHSYPETIKAIFSWVLHGKGNTVELAPLSALLQR